MDITYLNLIMINLIKHEIIHIVIYLFIYIVILLLISLFKYFLKNKNNTNIKHSIENEFNHLFKVKYILVGMLLTLLIDCDHLLDYILYFGFNFSLEQLLSARYFVNSGKVRVILHAWEWLVLLLVLYNVFNKDLYKKVIFLLFIALISQLIVDVFTYNTSFLSYSILFRAYHNFSISVFYKPNELMFLIANKV